MLGFRALALVFFDYIGMVHGWKILVIARITYSFRVIIIVKDILFLNRIPYTHIVCYLLNFHTN
jgi:hypothetical protein